MGCCRMLVYSVWLSVSLCVDTSRVGKVYQMVVHKPNEIPHFIREVDWISTIVWRSARKAACYLPPAVTRDGWRLLLHCSALHPEDPKCVVWRCGFFFGTFSTRMSIFLRDSLNIRLVLRDAICYYRFLSPILGKAVKNINVLKLRGVPTDVECNALLQPLLRGLLCNPEGEPGLQSFLLAGRKTH